MAAKRNPAGARRPELWLAHPSGLAGPARRQPQLERLVRDALLRRASGPGRRARPGAALSHSGSWVACGAGAGAIVGVDVEWIRRRAVLRLARFSFSAGEAAVLSALPVAARLARFHELWVLKEAAGKALGLPLFVALARCRFRFEGGRIHGELPQGIAWRAWVYAPRERLRLAWLSLDARGRAPLCMEWQHGAPDPMARRWPLVASGSK